MSGVAALLAVVVPAVFAALGIAVSGRSASWSAEWARTGALATLAAAGLELYAVLADGPATGIGLLGHADTGVVTIALQLRADQLSALVAVAVALVAFCVQVYSTGYDLPRYPGYAAAVSLFTAAMMLVVHADDLVLLLIGWEVMGACSYLLVGHHHERPAARAAAVKAFLVTRTGDLGLVLAVVVLLVGAGTTSIDEVTRRAASGELPSGTATLAALLLLAAVVGKSAQFPLQTWLPDAMEGPTPVSALIHAATMVAAGVFLVARLLPLFLAAPVALATASVIAAVTMLGAALAALAQSDLKRLLAWSTVSQVAYMLAGVSLARTPDGAGPGVLHLLSHAAFKALLFLVAGCVVHLVGSTSMAAMGGLRRTHPHLALLLLLGLGGLAGVAPLGGFWSKEAVLSVAESVAREGDQGGYAAWPAWLVLASGLATAVVTGLYAGRAACLVVLGDAPEGAGDHVLPRSMVWPLWLLAVPTVGLGLVLLHPPALLAVHLDPVTAVGGTVLALAGLGWAFTAPRLGARDVAAALPAPARSLLREGYRLDGVQHALVVRPYRALAGVVAGGDTDVVDAYPRSLVVAVRWGGRALRRLGDGVATGYVGWAVGGAVLLGLAGVVLS